MVAAALQAGFRESGAINIAETGNRPVTPMVAVRTAGLGLDSIIGYATEGGDLFSVVTKFHLETLMRIANNRFQFNTDRIDRFRRLLQSKYGEPEESKEQRRARKKTQGLQLKHMRENSNEGQFDVLLQADTDSLDMSNMNVSLHDFETI